MAITLRKFNAQVKDPDLQQWVPAGLLSSDALGAIDDAKTDAVTAINATGTAVEQSLPQTWDDLNDDVDYLEERLGFDEYLINNGLYKITSDDLVSGSWWYGSPHTDSTRARFPFLIPVRNGMTITYTVGAYDIWYGVLETPESQSFLQGNVWKTVSGVRSDDITADGYLAIAIRDHRSVSPATAVDIDPEDWDGTITILTRGTARGLIPNGTDFNTIKIPGIYFINGVSDRNYSNCPLPAPYSGTLEVFVGDANMVQRITRYGNGDTYVRTATTGNTFENIEWKYIPSRSQGSIASGTDLDTITSVGTYFIAQAAVGTYLNCPLPANVAGTLEVFAGSSPFGSYLSLVQRLTRHTDGVTYIRTSITGSFENRAWHCIEPSDKGAIPNGTDFDNIVAEGSYLIDDQASYSYSNNPLKNNVDGLLEVIRTGTSIIQRVTSSESDKGMYARSSRTVGTVQTFSDVEWKYIPTEAEINQRLKFGENFISSGMHSVSAPELVSGTWYYGSPNESSSRARFPFLIPVYAGMRIDYSVTDYDVFFGVLETPESNSYIQGGVWKTSSGSNITVEQNGYLTVVFRSHSDSTASIVPADWNGEFTIYTSFAAFIIGPFKRSIDAHSVPYLPQEAGNYVLKVQVIAGELYYTWAEV